MTTNMNDKVQDGSGIAEETGEEAEYDIYSLSGKVWNDIQEGLASDVIYSYDEIIDKLRGKRT